MKNIEDINKESVQKSFGKERKFQNFMQGTPLKLALELLEGKRERIQYFEGVCIAKKNREFKFSIYSS